MLGFDEFCEYVKGNIRKYMSDAFQKKNYEFCLDEKKDAYDMVTCSLRLEDKQNKTAEVPAFHLETAYENYKQTGDAEAIVVMLAGRYEAAYQAKFEKGEPLMPAFEVIAGDDGISKAFIISNMENEHIALYQDDILIEISAKECSNLVLFQINENVLLAVPVRNRKEYQECVDCMSIMQKDDPDMKQMSAEPQIKFYDKDCNVVCETGEEIESALQHAEAEKEQISKKRSVFSREKK